MKQQDTIEKALMTPLADANPMVKKLNDEITALTASMATDKKEMQIINQNLEQYQYQLQSIEDRINAKQRMIDSMNASFTSTLEEELPATVRQKIVQDIASFKQPASGPTAS